MSESEPPLSGLVHGLDPRALLALARKKSATPLGLGYWEPPTVEVLRASLPAYEILALLGRGGMGAVYLGRQKVLDREVAIKVLPVEAAADPDFAERFNHEMRTLARLHHPNIVTIHDSGHTLDSHPFYVMEYVNGEDLAQLLSRGPVPPSRAVEIVLGVCAALRCAHDGGIIHRDIKPANVLVAHDGAVKVADFGLARLHEEAGPLSRLTKSGTVVGTLDYMSPEQHAGKPLDSRADLFSTGVLLYEMLTGQIPRGAWQAPSELVKIDTRFDLIIRRALAPDPSRRFQNASELSLALESPQSSWTRRRLLAGALLVGGATVGFGAWWTRRIPVPENRTGSEPMTVFASLDLESAIVKGGWRWLNGQPKGTLELPMGNQREAKLLRLPIRPGAISYRLSFEALLTTALANFGVLLKTGATRVGVLFNQNSRCGLGQIRGKFWYENETTNDQLLPVGVWQKIDLEIRTEGEWVSVIARVEGNALISWDGPQQSLSLYELPPRGWAIGDTESLAFTSAHGGVQIRNAVFQRI